MFLIPNPKSTANANSAEGAAFSSHGRKAVDQDPGLKSRPVGPALFSRNAFSCRTFGAPRFLLRTIHGLTAVAIK